MAEAPKHKNRVVIILLIVIGLLALSLLALRIYRNAMDKKALEAGNTNNLNASSPAAGTGGGYTPPKNTSTSTAPATPNATVNDFPLKEGSTGDHVKFAQAAMNRIVPTLQRVPENGKFDHNMYLKLVTFVGTRFYPLTLATYTELLNKATSK